MRRGRWSILAAVLVAGIGAHCAPQVDIHGLFAKASSSNPRIAAEAQDKINQLILERRVDLFQAVLENSDDDLRGLALIFLGRIGTPEAVDVLSGYLVAETRFQVSRDPITALRQGNPIDSRFLVARLLNLLGPPDGAVERVLPSLDSSDHEEKVAAILVLGALGEPSAAPYLIPLATDPDPEIEKRAVETLGRLRNPVAVPVLLDRAVEPQSVSRRMALSMLDLYRDPTIPERLLEAFPGVEEPPVRFAMVSLMGRFPDPRVVTTLIGVLDSPDPNVRRMAETRICELTHRPPGKSKSDWERWWKENRQGYRFPS